jgi:hypothetical protein
MMIRRVVRKQEEELCKGGKTPLVVLGDKFDFCEF